jgi:hypothetical protein
LLGLKSKRVKEKSILIDFWIKIGLEIEERDSGGRNIWGKIPRKLQRIWEGKNGDLSEFWSTRTLRKEFLCFEGFGHGYK